MPLEPVLQVSHLTVRRGRFFLLKNLTWRVERGEHWAVIGANGSGKTSLVRCLTGHLPLSHGTVEVLGQRYGESDWRELRRRVGLVTSAIEHSIPADEPALETVISGHRAMLGLWGRISRKERADARRHLRQVGIGALGARPWAWLSQGERQRVLIARALMACPTLLILDEPCAGLDPAARAHFLAWLERLARDPRSPALVLVTHHLEEITRSFTHALVLRKGHALASGPRSRSLAPDVLSAAYEAPVRLRRLGGRVFLEIAGAARGVM